jgi:bacteriorhodopsin
MVYAFMAGIWALYGVAALFQPVLKNAAYNVLDVISKNFYGIFLSILIYSKSVKSKSS